MRRSTYFFIAFCCLPWLATLVIAEEFNYREFENYVSSQENSTEAGERVELFAQLDAVRVQPGEQLKLQLQGRVSAFQHIYSVIPQKGFSPEATQLSVTLPWLQPQGKLQESEPISIVDQAFDSKLLVHQNDFWIHQTFKVAKNAPKGLHQFEGILKYQVCDNKICSLPLSKKFPLKLIIY
ncbi:MAG: hypothetical protein COB67_02995 [SAR324 cluster bacterium]|uniref:Uncharacterized protein n=1 Tax=SAR324 cluster bacterium TaxID=2024889 RepID=A0A2A4T8P3_9DELT|nr:MAG: hypothetical protein COB67_02995 [SAR324 cluster bacterium]